MTTSALPTAWASPPRTSPRNGRSRAKSRTPSRCAATSARLLHRTRQLQEEIAPYPLDDRYPDLRSRGVKDDRRVVENDEGPRRDTNAEVLAKLRPVFKRDGSVTAGNS